MSNLKVSVYLAFVILFTACGGSSKSNPHIVELPINSLMHNNGPIVIFGDSIANGLGSSNTDKYSLKACLRKNTDRDVYVVAVNGASSYQLISRVSQVTAYNPSLVVMSLGGNDVLRNTPVKLTYDAIKTIFSELTGQSLNLYIGLKPPQAMAKAAGIDPSRLDIVSEIAEEEGAIVIENGFEGMWGRPMYMADQIHPNDAGYTKLCERVVVALKNHYRFLN